MTIVTDTANQSESCRIAVSQYIMLAGPCTGCALGVAPRRGLTTVCNDRRGGGGFRVTADPLLFIYSVSRLFVQTYSERPRAITARPRATPSPLHVNSLRYTYHANNHFASFEIALLNIPSRVVYPPSYQPEID